MEIHDSLLDSGTKHKLFLQSFRLPPFQTNLTNKPTFLPDIDGALIIAEQEELAGNNVTLDYVINDNGTCTCKLCGEVTQSRTHWYRHKYKVKL